MWWPQEIPATIFLMGTPAAIRAIQDAQVDAMDVDPFDSNEEKKSILMKAVPFPRKCLKR